MSGNRSHRQILLWALPLALLCHGCAAVRSPSDGEAEQIEQIRQAERDRLRALVEADLTVAHGLHADEFQLINPAGVALTKEEYMSAIGSGQLDYRVWEPGEIIVRWYGEAAVIRYLDADWEVHLGGQLVHRGPMYHTNLYERREGQWQVVWSQASGVTRR
jgi:hypothetical protein